MALERLNSLKVWHDYFTKNGLKPDGIPWNAHDTFSDEERRCIEKSIAAFQLGEYSEGRGLLKFAARYAEKYDDEYLVGITRLFVSEEQNHALLLKRFMARHGIECIKRNWTDTVFRRLRKDVGYELSVTVLITAEIIALIYYKALRACTGSVVLKAVCDKILADETAHVEYESEVLSSIRNAKPWPLKRAANFQHQFLFCGTVLVVYFEHQRVLRRGGYSLGKFWAACWTEYMKCFSERSGVPVATEV